MTTFACCAACPGVAVVLPCHSRGDASDVEYKLNTLDDDDATDSDRLQDDTPDVMSFSSSSRMAA